MTVLLVRALNTIHIRSSLVPIQYCYIGTLYLSIVISVCLTCISAFIIFCRSVASSGLNIVFITVHAAMEISELAYC
jgi:hypothetical protein